MDHPEEASSSPLPAEVDVRPKVEPTVTNHVEAQSQNSRRQLRVETGGIQLQQLGTHSMSLGFQDSNLSPGLSLVPENASAQNNFTEYSLFQQSDAEFVPLRPYPDVSMASMTTFPPQDLATNESEHLSLSQHPLAQETLLSEENVGSSPPQHRDQSRLEDKVETLVKSLNINDTNRKKLASDFFEDASKDETFFLNKDVSAQRLLKLLEKDVELPSNTSSAVSSGSEASLRSTASFPEGQKTTDIGTLGTKTSMVTREGPSGKDSNAQKHLQQPDSVQKPDRSAEVCNITVGSRNTQPDESSEALRRELLSEVEQRSRDDSEHRNQDPKPPTPLDQSDTPYQREPGSFVQGLHTGPNSARVDQIKREQDLWSSGNQTGIDGSYLGFVPQSQSTPGILKPQSKSNAKVKFGQLSDIESNPGSTNQSSPVPAQPSDLVPDVHHTDSASQQRDEVGAEVKSLPVLSYMQKVDAWKVNQSSGKPSLFDSLALQGFSGVSPKKKAYDAVSDSLNRILSQQARSLQQPLISSPNFQDVPRSSSVPTSGTSSPRRGEAVGSAPSERDNTGSAAQQSQSSLSTVVGSVHKDQQTDRPAEEQEVKVNDPITTDHFSDESLNPNLNFSGSQEVKHQTSIGASSVVSLEIDNYVPHWTSKLTSPPPLRRPRELNIDERIPVYLHNLGIDQSPSRILTSFVPSGPIREPEFSPTEISTLKGSIATPPQSTQSPHKDSVLSADSHTSLPISVDSLGPAVSVSGRARWTSPSSKILALTNQGDLLSRSLSEEDSQSSVLNVSQELSKSDLESSLTVKIAHEKGPSEAHSNNRVTNNGDDSFVSSRALMEIRKLLTRAESIVSARSPLISSLARQLHTENTASFSVKRDSLFSTTHNDNAGARSSQLWTTSSPDPVLPNFLPTQDQPLTSTTASCQTTLESSPTPTTLVLSKSALRTEPEGCSSAPPDKALKQPSVPQPPQQLSSPPAAGDMEEEEEVEAVTTPTAADSPQRTPSSSVQEDTDQEVMSEASSQSSLALRVAKLLQSESPATMMSSTPSITDNEESKAREWIKLKISGQQCGALNLDEEDRKKIEEIKRELMLKNPVKSQASTDTESSDASSLRRPTMHGPSTAAETYVTNGLGNIPLKGSLNLNLTEPLSHPQSGLRSALEAKVSEIASREGVTLHTKTPQALTSITIATYRRSTSPSPPTSPTPLSSTPELLLLTELSTAEPTAADIQFQSTENRSTQTNGPPLVIESQPDTSLSAGEGMTRQETVGGQSDPSSQVSGGEDVQKNITQALKETEESNPTGPFPGRTGHVSQVHLTLSPKAPYPTQTLDPSSRPNIRPHATQRDFVTLRHSSSIGTSPDEGVGSSSPLEWSDAREPAKLQATGRTDPSGVFQTAAPLRAITNQSPQPNRAEASLQVPASGAPAPVLLPYKPCGSEELFYIPQTDTDASSTATTMESSHTGSDDAVPPRFSSDILGHRDPGLDRGVTIRHTEGIYSKRLKTTTFKMHDAANREAPSVSSESPHEAQRRDQGTSPILFPGPHQQDHTVPRLVQRSHEESASQPPSLDLLWQRFCDQWESEQARPISDRETSLLERLDRLSRLINRTRDARFTEEEGFQFRTRARWSEIQGHKGRREDRPHISLSLHEEETSQSVSFSSSFSTSADRQESDTVSSISTVDTVRLIRVFGAHKVQRLKSSSSLSKLYSTINKQKEMEHRSTAHILAPLESTDESAVVESTSSSSTYVTPARRGPSRTLTAKRAVKLVDKGIQAGDLEIVSNGTRRHTRDVGTTFPSPAITRGAEQISTSSSYAWRGRSVQRSPSKSQGVHRQRKNKRMPGKSYPAGVCWFIPADPLRSEARKENRAEDDPSAEMLNCAWFEPYSRAVSWREPLRQKQVHHQEGNEQSLKHPTHRTKPVSTGLMAVSLQEALEAHRPQFIHRSRQRMRRLALQVEERRQQGLFGRERDDLFLTLGGRHRLPKPAGRAPLRRAVPRKEMIQRSKQIYESLPEVQRRREEEKRKAEYRSYRLNAQLYNKKITNRVLGKRLAWQ